MVETRELATKSDIAELKALVSDMKNRIMRSTYNAMYGLVAAVAACAAVVIAILK